MFSLLGKTERTIMAVKKRNELDPAYCWDLEAMYADDDIWEEEFSRVSQEAEDFRTFCGKMQEGPECLLKILKSREKMERKAEHLYVYANMRWHQDTANGKYQAMAGKSAQLLTQVNDAQAFVEPEILALTEQKVQKYIDSCPGLELYKRFFSEIFRGKEHVLTPDLEALLARAQDMANAPQQIFMNFNNADLVFGEIQDENGDPVTVTHGNYTVLLKSRDRRVREAAFHAVYGAYEAHKNTLAATMDANTASQRFFASARKYVSSRAMALDGAHIPERVYDELIRAVHEGLPAMYRYMQIRKRVMDVDALHMYDVYVPLTESPEKRYTFEEAKQMVKDALSVMGEEYVSLLQEGFDNGWIDVFENEGKRSGAYSWGSYDSHPYVLLNYHGSLSDVFTLAHEMGHAIHSYYSHKNQPYVYAEYHIFVAEVASICNEMLLVQYLIGQAKDAEEKKYLINYLLEQFRTTLFRQTMFAEFEMKAHELKEKGQTLTSQNLCEIYHDLNRQYFGPDVVIDEEIAMEWSRIPHFYTPFYVYQYATGFAAALAISGKIFHKKEGVLDSYKAFLSGGCSMDCTDLLKLCDVDMTKPEPVMEALSIFDKYLEEFEKLF